MTIHFHIIRIESFKYKVSYILSDKVMPGWNYLCIHVFKQILYDEIIPDFRKHWFQSNVLFFWLLIYYEKKK